MDASSRHFDSEEDAKQLRKGNQPEKDRRHGRCSLLHLSALFLTDDLLMVDASNPGHSLRRDFDLADNRALEKSIPHRQVVPNRILNVPEGFLLSCALRPTTRQPGDRYAVPFIGLE